jgi:ligand-binding sensor domain-containing protein/putative methionine-R-sulfoxide reductase with GAF domain
MRLFLAAAMLAQYFFAPAQDISFFHLNTANGLSDNLVTTAVRDKDGILWIGTAEGLNSYDGYTVKKYFKEDEPSMASNNIAGLIADDSNRVWVRNYSNKITLVDEKRKLISVPVMDNGSEVSATMFCKTRSRGVLVFYGNKIFTLQKGARPVFERVKWKEDSSLFSGYVHATGRSSDTVIITANGKLCVFDAAAMKVRHIISVPGIISAAWLNKEEMLVTTQADRHLLRINLEQKKIIANYGIQLKDQFGEPVQGYLRYIGTLNNGKYIISSGYAGVYIFDANAEKLFRYGHNPLNSQSVSANNTAYLFTDSTGYAFIATRTSGLNYFNINFQFAEYHSAFQENKTGKILHGFINCIAREPGGNFWLGTQTGLMEWDRAMNVVRFPDFGNIDGVPFKEVEEVRALCFDRRGRLWVGTNRYGIVVLDKNKRPFKYFSTRSALADERLPGNWLNSFLLRPDNKIWASTAGGLCIINTETMKVEKINENLALKPLEKTMSYSVWFRNPDELWVGTNKGAYRYRYSTNQLYLFDTAQGLPARIIYGFAADNTGTVYAAGYKGLFLFRDDTLKKIYLRSNRLVNDRCYGLIKDADGQLWIGNDNTLLCYNPADSSFRAFDESYGLSPSGYRQLSFFQDEDGKQFWGSDAGLAFFAPGQLKKINRPLKAAIHSFTAGGQTYTGIADGEVSIPYANNHLTFIFSAIDLYSSKNLVYEYKLEGADADWIRTNSPQQVTYSKLKPGKYTFRARVSKEGFNWTEANNPPTIVIATPWWKSWWFASICVLALLASAFYFIRSRNNKVREQKEELETEQAINHFATSMSGQGTVDDTIWDVAKNCIGHLGFEDCVIYLLDEKRNVLVQKAAWGPKTTDENKILNPIEISLGKGIVGVVAKTGKAEIISDTSKDDRYIVDDVRRFSEIAVPVVSDGRVLGVIDSENSRKNYFTQRHLSILTTIASLCANKIVRARAEEEKQKAEKNLSETERQTAEMEMQALRAQMNPHFMFNSLNSINNFILKNDSDNASQYLTRFSRLMRLILDNSREDWVLLENEIKALELYIEMEAIRFDNVFEHSIKTAFDINTSAVMVPPMIVQPYVENAIWHGLLHRKEPGSKLLVDIWKKEDKLFIKVEDNGVGRQEAQLLKVKFSSHKKSHGMRITAKRLEIVNKIYKVDAKVHMEDLKNGEGMPAGTSVTLEMKYKTNHGE